MVGPECELAKREGMGRDMKKIFLLISAVLASFFLVTIASASIPPNIRILNQYCEKMMYHERNLIDIRKNIHGDDDVMVYELFALTGECHARLSHLTDLILIISVIENANDKNNIIAPLLKLQITSLYKYVDGAIKRVNLCISHFRNQAVLSTAIELRSDFFGLKEFLEKLRQQ